jgi:hypothetical protein
LGQNWRKMPDLPPMRGGLIVPYDYAEDRRPQEPRFDAPDGILAEAVDILKDGGAVAFRMRLGYEDELGCVHTFQAGPAEIRYAAESLLRRLSAMANLRLVFVAEPGRKDGIVLDDKDGRGVPEARFFLAAGARCERCKCRVCACPPDAAEERAELIRATLGSDA